MNTSPRFGLGDGYATLDIDPLATYGADEAYNVYVLSDGKIVIGGSTGASPHRDFLLVRLQADGTFDQTFDGDGVVATDFGVTYDHGLGLALQTDGKFVVFGETRYGSSNMDFGVVRYNADGTIDTTFGSSGFVTTPIGTGDDIPASAVVQADGKIVVAGGSGGDIAIVRYTATGLLDTTFDFDGKVTLDTGAYDSTSELLLQSDGKLIVAGDAGGDSLVARYNAGGTLDTGFGTSGLVVGTLDSAADAVLQTDGKLLIVGRISQFVSGVGDVNQSAVARYNDDGSLDASFGTGGIFQDTVYGSSGYVLTMALQNDGKIVLAGYVGNDIILMRLDADGSLDTGFGTGGTLTTPL